MAKAKYKRVLLKLSGESLSGQDGLGIDPHKGEAIAQRVLRVIGYTDRHHAVFFKPRPLMGGQIFTLCGGFTHAQLPFLCLLTLSCCYYSIGLNCRITPPAPCHVAQTAA